MARQPFLLCLGQACAFLLFPFALSALIYDVQFVGLSDAECLKAMQARSGLVSLEKRPPASVNGLRYRIEGDIPTFMQVLHAFSYYDAFVSYELAAQELDAYKVTIFIQPGARFKLGSYQVLHGGCIEPLELPGCCPFTAEELGLNLGKSPTSVELVNGELEILSQLSRCGYPLAFLDKRRIEVDRTEKEINASVCVEEGPFSKFGPVSIFGLTNIQPRYIERRIAWREGETYDNDLIADTQNRIMSTNLFSSVYISHGDELDANGELPMKMRLTEAKHRQLSVGAFYGTVDGPGVVFAWTHRNIRGMGEIVHFKGEVSTRVADGHLEYKKPDFLTPHQSYRIAGDISSEKISPYHAFSYQVANFIERKWELADGKRSASAGLKVEHIHVSNSASDGTYLLMGLPIYAEYDTSDDPLNPTKGMSLVYQLIPYQSLFEGGKRFVKQRLTGTTYIRLSPGKRVILALRAQLGSVAGARQPNVPLPILFLGGSIDDLRGYRYKTVSPLNSNNQPLGGRSAIFLTVETRILLMEKIGLVPFFDVGTVNHAEIPTFSGEWFKSIGVGLRYFAFFGPLRFDVGFPLDRRKGIDPLFRLYASIGQAF
ncbi:MAG TPA: BamA/TamA family outer membrane protein [Chlamydiales bacterium]